MIWTLRRILILIVLISSLAVVGTLVWVTATYQRFAIDTQNEATGTLVKFLARQRVQEQYHEKVAPFIDEWSRLSTLVSAMKQNSAETARFSANRMMHTLEVTSGRVHLRNVAIYSKSMELFAEAEDGTRERMSSRLELNARLKGRDLREQRVITSYLWRTPDGRPLHSTIAPIGGFQVAGFIEFVTDPMPELRGLSEALNGEFRLLNVDGDTLFQGDVPSDATNLAGPPTSRGGISVNPDTLRVEITGVLGDVWAVAALTRDNSEFRGAISTLRDQAISIVALVVVSSVLTGWLLLRLSVFRSLSAFAGAMGRLTDGDTDVEIPRTGPDEFATMRTALQSLRTAVETRKAARDEAERRASLMTDILESSPIGVTIELEDGDRWFVNERQVENFGAGSKDELIAADTGESFVDPQDRARLREMTDGLGRNAYINQKVLRRRLDGSTWWASMTKVPFEYEGQPAEIVWLQDISEAVESQRSATLLTEAIDNLPDLVSLFDRDERVVFTNNRYHEIYPDAPAKEEIVGRKMEDLLRQSLQVGQIDSDLAKEDPESWIEQVLSRRRSTENFIAETTHRNGYSYEVRHWKTVEGGLIVVQTDITERNKSRQALEDREAELAEKTMVLETMLDAMGQGVAVYDADHKLTLCNRSYVETTGLPSPEEAIGMSNREVFMHIATLGKYADGDPAEIARKRYEDSVSGDLEANDQVTYTDGTVYDVRRRKMPDGGYVLVMTDITELKNTEEELRESQQRLTDAIESLPIGFVLYDRDERLTIWNEEMNNALPFTRGTYEEGMTYEGLLRTGIEGKWVPGAVGREEEWIQESLKIFRNTRQEGREITFKNGQTVYAIERRTSDGGTVAIRMDITERQRMQEALRASEERLRAIIDNTPNSIYLKDREGRYTLVNKANAERQGYDPGEMLGLTAYDHFSQEIADTIDSHEKEVLKSGLASEREAVLTIPGQKPYAGLMTKFPVFDADGEITAIGTITTDITERKEMEQALRESEQQMTQILEACPVGAVISNQDSERLWVNSRIAELYGVTKDSLLNADTGPSFVDIEDRDRVLRRFEQEGQVFDEEVRLKRPDGSFFWGLVSTVPIEFDGEPCRLNWTYNIHDRKQAEEDLVKARADAEEQARLLRITLDNIGQGILVHDVDTRPLLWNDLATRFAGIPVEMLERGATLEERRAYQQEHLSLDPHSANVIDEFDRRVAAGERDIVASYQRHGYEEGTWIQVHLRALPDGMSVRIYQDITELKATETEARETADLLRLTMEHIDQGFSVRDIGGNVLLFNNRLSELLGIPREFYERTASRREFQDHHERAGTHTLIAPELQNAIDTWIEKAEKGEEVERLVYERPGPHDTWLLCVLNQTPDRKQVRSFTDITRLKQTEQEANQATASAQQAQRFAEEANRAKSDFLSSMSHELRTPLNAIIGFSSFIAEDVENPLTADQKECVAHVLQSGRHLLTLIDEVLDLSKIESGAVALSLEAIDAVQVVDECVSLTNSQAARRHVRINNPANGRSLPPIRVDRTRFKQVLLNLLSNAVKYNRDGGSVGIEHRLSGPDKVRVSVADTGNGIPADRLDKLFDPFDRLGAENSEVEGTGIGLTITKRLIEQMGGEIGVESVVGRGTTFWVEFPVSEATAETETMADEADMNGGHIDIEGKILYVEDNPTNLDLVRKIMSRQAGVDLLTAITAEHGIERARNELPDVVLMDINLPGMDGYEALARLEDMPETRHIPVIAVTAAATQEDLKKGQASGFFAYLTKPIQAENLLATILRALHPAETEVEDASRLRTDRKVLVVDDVAVNLTITARQLEKLGLEALTTSDPVEGLELLKSGEFAAALVDISMPVMSGLELTSRLRDAENELGHRTPIVALTASHGTEDELRRFREAGMDAQLAKPVVLGELAALLRRWLTPETGDVATKTEATSETTVQPPIDLIQLGEILGIDDKAEFVDLLGMFVDYFPKALETLEEAATSGDPETIRDAAHAAKSGSANAAARPLTARLQQIEHNAKNGELGDVDAAVEAVRAEFERIVRFLTEYADEGS